MLTLLNAAWREPRGATRLEIGLVAAMAAIFAVLALTDFGNHLGGFFVSFKVHMADGGLQ